MYNVHVSSTITIDVVHWAYIANIERGLDLLILNSDKIL